MFVGIILLQALSIIILGMQVFYIFDRSMSRQHTFLLVLVIATLLNNLGYFLEMVAGSKALALYGIKVAYIGKAYIPLVFLLFVIFFCDIYINKAVRVIAFVIHTAVWIFVQYCEQLPIFYTDIGYTKSGLFPHLVLSHGFLYYTFMGLNCIYGLIGIILLFLKYINTDEYTVKKQTSCIMLVILFSFGGLICYGFQITGGYDTTALGFALGSISLLVALVKYNLVSTVEIAKSHAIDQLSEGLIVTDPWGEPVFYNPVAREIEDSVEKVEGEDYLSKDTVYSGKNVYRVDRSEIFDREKFLGKMYLLSDITDSYYYTERLEDEVAIQTKTAEDRREKVEQMSLQVIRTLANTIDAKDTYTNGHSTRVAEYAVILARELGYNEEQLANLRYAALLHDIGKIGVPDKVLNKRGRLSDTEYEIIKLHPIIGGEILHNIENIVGAEDVALHHHERYDGRGYPQGLKGKNIPELARIVGIADSFDAMNSRRVYRKALPLDKIRLELVRGAGTQFDPDFVKIFIRLFDEGKVELGPEYFNINPDDDTVSTDEAQKVIKTISVRDNTSKDYLTGLPMRHEGEQAITELMKESDGCLAIIDVDNFKVVNDHYGHKLGDSLLKGIGDILVSLEDRGIPCRLGGDEFLFFMENVSKAEAINIINKIIIDFDRRKVENVAFIQTSLSVGLCMTTTVDQYGDIRNKADKALYYIKKNNKVGYQFYEKSSDSVLVETDVDLEELVTGITHSNHNKANLQGIDFSVFEKMFEYTKGIDTGYEHEYELAMITIDAKEVMDIDEIENAMNCMDQSVKNNVRNVDIYARYSSVQFLVIFMNLDENIENVINRIFTDFYKLYHGKKVEVMYSTAKLSGEDVENGAGN